MTTDKIERVECDGCGQTKEYVGKEREREKKASNDEWARIITNDPISGGLWARVDVCPDCGLDDIKEELNLEDSRRVGEDA